MSASIVPITCPSLPSSLAVDYQHRVYTLTRERVGERELVAMIKRYFESKKVEEEIYLTFFDMTSCIKPILPDTGEDVSLEIKKIDRLFKITLIFYVEEEMHEASSQLVNFFKHPFTCSKGQCIPDFYRQLNRMLQLAIRAERHASQSYLALTSFDQFLENFSLSIKARVLPTLIDEIPFISLISKFERQHPKITAVLTLERANRHLAIVPIIFFNLPVSFLIILIFKIAERFHSKKSTSIRVFSEVIKLPLPSTFLEKRDEQLTLTQSPSLSLSHAVVEQSTTAALPENDLPPEFMKNLDEVDRMIEEAHADLVLQVQIASSPMLQPHLNIEALVYTKPAGQLPSLTCFPISPYERAAIYRRTILDSRNLTKLSIESPLPLPVLQSEGPLTLRPLREIKSFDVTECGRLRSWAATPVRRLQLINNENTVYANGVLGQLPDEVLYLIIENIFKEIFASSPVKVRDAKKTMAALERVSHQFLDICTLYFVPRFETTRLHQEALLRITSFPKPLKETLFAFLQNKTLKLGLLELSLDRLASCSPSPCSSSAALPTCPGYYIEYDPYEALHYPFAKVPYFTHPGHKAGATLIDFITWSMVENIDLLLIQDPFDRPTFAVPYVNIETQEKRIFIVQKMNIDQEEGEWWVWIDKGIDPSLARVVCLLHHYKEQDSLPKFTGRQFDWIRRLLSSQVCEGFPVDSKGDEHESELAKRFQRYKCVSN